MSEKYIIVLYILFLILNQINNLITSFFNFFKIGRYRSASLFLIFIFIQTSRHVLTIDFLFHPFIAQVVDKLGKIFTLYITWQNLNYSIFFRTEISVWTRGSLGRGRKCLLGETTGWVENGVHGHWPDIGMGNGLAEWPAVRIMGVVNCESAASPCQKQCTQ